MLLRHDALGGVRLSRLKVENNVIMTKTCPRCGKTFECVHSIDCWCVKVQLKDSTKAYLKEHYHDCLCKECLEKLNAE